MYRLAFSFLTVSRRYHKKNNQLEVDCNDVCFSCMYMRFFIDFSLPMYVKSLSIDFCSESNIRRYVQLLYLLIQPPSAMSGHGRGVFFFADPRPLWQIVCLSVDHLMSTLFAHFSSIRLYGHEWALLPCIRFA